MQKTYSAILVLLLITNCLFSQTGTIKIAKPPAAKKDTVIPAKRYTALGINVGSNYSFKGINQLGYDAEVVLPLGHGLFWGVKYSHENEYYNLSPYNPEVVLQEQISGKSENKSDYIKVPVGVSYNMSMGRKTSFHFMAGLEGQYLFNIKNQYDRLKYGDFKKYNLAGFVGIGIPLRERFSVNFRYTKDFFDNLKDKNIYNNTGEIVGKQKSKTNLLSLSISFTISR